ncbi:MAG: phosphatidate cytidylyltransferase [Alphaproteobacteria bacterium]|nr:phosphatidate cytidylyltransferase [Alphaproteobacteria bacterium]MBR3502120.1 phosphatidate cytidylyltransferase [Alphaproteobacteria bacterium]
MVSRKMGAMIKRILAALVMIPIAVITLYVGSPYVEVLAVMVGGLLAWEWANMLSSPQKASHYVTAYMITLAVSIWGYNFSLIIPIICIVSLLVYVLAEKEKYRKLLTLGVPYISIGIASLIWIYRSFDPSEGNFDPRYNYSFVMTMWFFLMVWSMDIGGLVVGCNLKGPKLAPKISPNKTWSGLCGGMLLAMSVSIIYMYFWTKIMDVPFYDFTHFRYISFSYKTLQIHRHWNIDGQMFYAVLAMIIALISQIGDLIESAIKRRVGVKDSSKLIPGHGGVFDRIDGLIFAAPLVYLFFIYIL